MSDKSARVAQVWVADLGSLRTPSATSSIERRGVMSDAPTDDDRARLCPECGFDIVTPDCPFCVSQYERECANAAANAAHLDRGLTPRPAWMLDRQPGDTDDCAWWRASFATFQHRAWRAWFDDGEYLGEVSARVGPDDVGAVQKCKCEQCSQKPKEQP